MKNETLKEIVKKDLIYYIHEGGHIGLDRASEIADDILKNERNRNIKTGNILEYKKFRYIMFPDTIMKIQCLTGLYFRNINKG